MSQVAHLTIFLTNPWYSTANGFEGPLKAFEGKSVIGVGYYFEGVYNLVGLKDINTNVDNTGDYLIIPSCNTEGLNKALLALHTFCKEHPAYARLCDKVINGFKETGTIKIRMEHGNLDQEYTIDEIDGGILTCHMIQDSNIHEASLANTIPQDIKVDHSTVYSMKYVELAGTYVEAYHNDHNIFYPTDITHDQTIVLGFKNPYGIFVCIGKIAIDKYRLRVTKNREGSKVYGIKSRTEHMDYYEYFRQGLASIIKTHAIRQYQDADAEYNTQIIGIDMEELVYEPIVVEAKPQDTCDIKA